MGIWTGIGDTSGDVTYIVSRETIESYELEVVGR